MGINLLAPPASPSSTQGQGSLRRRRRPGGWEGALRGALSSALLLSLLLALPVAASGPAAPPQPAAAAETTPAPAASAKRAFSIEDLYRLRIPSAVRLDPSGEEVVYLLETRDLGRGKSNQDLYRLPIAGGEPRRLTTTDEDSESAPAWSPDGKSIAFVSARGGSAQIWILPADGGEAWPLTDLSTGAADPLWSPDGRWIAFLSQVHAECGADDGCNKRLDEMRDKDPLRAHVADELLYRHWNAWGEGKVTHVLVVEVATKKVRDLTPGEREAPVFSLGGVDFAFSLDSRELAYTRNPDPVENLARSTNSDLWAVPLEPGPDGGTAAARNLTADNAAWDGSPRYSPDGRWIAFRRQLRPAYESDLVRLALLERATGKVRLLTEGFDDWVTDFAWLRDSSGIVFRADVEGQTPLYAVDLAGGAPRRLASFAYLDEFELLPGGKEAVAVRRSVGQPSEIWVLDLAGGKPPRRLTTHNQALEREVDIRPAESFWVTGAEGKQVQVFLVKPHDFDPAKKYPLILNIHGGPQMQWSDAFRGDWQVYPGAGFLVAFPNPHGSTGYGQAYTEAISGDWGGKVMEDLMKVTDHLETFPYVDRERIGAMGWSWGGYAVFWLAGQTERYAALASMMGAFNLPSKYGATEELWFPEWDLQGTPWTSAQYETFNPARFVDRWKTPMLVVTGERDYRIPYTESLQAFTALRRQGIPARLVVLPDSGHWPGWYEMALYYTAHLEWFHRWLGGDPPPWTTADFAAGKVFDPQTGERRKPE